jgi:hypothetical protein
MVAGGAGVTLLPELAVPTESRRADRDPAVREVRTPPHGGPHLAKALGARHGANGRAQSLEEQTRRPPGTSSLDDDSERLRHGDCLGDADTGTDSLDDDSMDLSRSPADANHTSSLDDGSLGRGSVPSSAQR